MSDFKEIEKICAYFLSKLDNKEMARVNRAIASTIRKSQSARITRQENPDGSAYPKRKLIKNRKGEVRRGAMFNKLKTARWLKQVGNAQGITINFDQRVRRIAKTHQWGETERFGNVKIDMPERQLLGLTEAEQQAILDAIVAHVDLE